MTTAPDASGRAPAAPTSALSPFRHPIFRAVWIANLVSQLGGMVQAVGASWMMLSIAASAEMVSLVQTATTLPIVAFSLLAGALADNFNRRRIMIGAQVFMLLVSLALAACAWFSLITPWLLLLMTFLIGCGAAFNGPAWHASVGEMVPREELPTAVALNSMGFNVARSVGPALGGFIVAAAGAASAFALNAVTYSGIIAVLGRWRPRVEQQVLPREELGPAMLAGIRYVAMSPNINSTLLRAFVFGLGASALTALMPLIARDQVGGGAVVYGLLLGAFGAGAVGGAFFVHHLRRIRSSEKVVRGATLAFAAAVAVAALSPWLPLTLPAMLVSGAGWVLTLATFNVTVQMSAPRWVVARALALYQTVTFGGMAAGSWVWGVATGQLGLAGALLGSVLVLLAAAALGLRFTLPETTALDLHPLSRWREPPVGLTLARESGPVVVTIEYRIAEAGVPEFLAVMAHRKRIRRRDGARGWTLLRDLADPGRWIERYHSPTWIEYVRHNLRITRDDAAVGERLRALHEGPEPPRVRRMILQRTDAPAAAAVPRAVDLAEPLTNPVRQS